MKLWVYLFHHLRERVAMIFYKMSWNLIYFHVAVSVCTKPNNNWQRETARSRYTIWESLSYSSSEHGDIFTCDFRSNYIQCSQKENSSNVCSWCSWFGFNPWNSSHLASTTTYSNMFNADWKCTIAYPSLMSAGDHYGHMTLEAASTFRSCHAQDK